MPTRVPKYRRQRRNSGRDNAFVEIDGKRHFLGAFDSPDSHEKYAKLIGEWERGGIKTIRSVTVKVLCAKYLVYLRDDKKVARLGNYKPMIRVLLQHYADVPTHEFGPKKLKTTQKAMAEMPDWSRKYINQQINYIRTMFKWGVSEELVPSHVLEGLRAVEGLRHGRENNPVMPVPDVTVEATLPHLTPTIRAMVRLQRLTGMRPAEVCIMRPVDIDTSDNVWVYRPEHHKNTHRGHIREVFLCRECQRLIQPLLNRRTNAYLFSPREAEQARMVKLRAKRKSKVQPSQEDRSRPGAKQPGEHYTTNSYRVAIQRACKTAGIARWSPNQLRHSRATEVREQHGIEVAQVILGHKRIEATQIYAEPQRKKAIEVLSTGT